MTLAAADASPVAAATAPGAWSAKSPMPLARGEIQTASIAGKIFVLGGNSLEMKDGKPIAVNNSTLNQMYDPATDTWHDLAPMPFGVNHAAVAVLDGKIYLAGGFTAGRHMNATDRFDVYDPATDRWQDLAPLSFARGAAAMAAVAGKIHILGGRIADAEPTLTSHESYDPKTNRWAHAAPLASGRDHTGIAVENGKIHVFAGRSAELTSNIANHDVYDPATDTWSVAAPIPTPRSSGASANYRGLLFFLGGECADGRNGKPAFDENEAYDPKTGSWRSLAPLPVGRHGMAASVVNDRLYLIGGATGCGTQGLLAETLVFALP